ncbi:MAG: helix-hairpin-helix domain-containing protein [Isosphaeraceae bacterium]|nr:helix-hairpin-helix domain-containing protein [Isosphaeraceae bacterium]
MKRPPAFDLIDDPSRGGPLSRPASPGFPEVFIGSTLILGLSILGLSAAFDAKARGTTDELHVDPNSAPPALLAALPRLGPALVGRIVEAREQSAILDESDLDRIPGIGPRTLEEVRPYLSFGDDVPPAPSPKPPGDGEEHRSTVANQGGEPGP